MTGVAIAPWLYDSRWPTVAIRRVALLGTGHTPSRSKPEYWINCNVPWVTLADVWQLRDGTVDVILDTKEKISDAGLLNSSAVKHPKGTVVLSRTASVGFSAIIGDDMATSQDFATWTCGPLLHPRFLLQALRAMSPDLKRIAAGSTHKTIYMPDIENLRIPLPSIDEQKRIVSFIDAEKARIDALVSARIKQLRGLDELAAALLSERLVPGMLSAPTGRQPWPWLPNSKNLFPLVRLGYVSRLQNGLTIDSDRDLSGDVVTRPYLRVANVQSGFVALDSVTEVTVPRLVAERCTLRPGDVLMTEGGDLDKLGRGAVWGGELPNCLHQNHIFAVRPDRSRLNGEFLALMTQTLHGRCYFESTGTKTTNLASTNSSKILAFPVPLPPVDVQQHLVKQLKGELSSIEAAKDALRHQRDILVERRQALITAAVTGQLDVTTARGADV